MHDYRKGNNNPVLASIRLTIQDQGKVIKARKCCEHSMKFMVIKVLRHAIDQKVYAPCKTTHNISTLGCE